MDNKEHQHQKLVHKKSGLAAAGGMTQQQLIELQHKLFEEARAATLSGPLPSQALDPSVLAGVVLPSPAGEPEPAAAATSAQPLQAQQGEQQSAQQPKQAAQQPAGGQPGQQLDEQQQQHALADALPAAQQVQQASGAAGETAAGAAEGGGPEDSLDDVDVGDVDSEIV